MVRVPEKTDRINHVNSHTHVFYTPYMFLLSHRTRFRTYSEVSIRMMVNDVPEFAAVHVTQTDAH